MIAVISQPMLFPWPGLIEQASAADVYVNYSDVQFSKGSFVNRVQLKTSSGTQWLTVPLSNLHLGQRIDEVCLSNSKNWRQEHRDRFSRAYVDAPFVADALSLMNEVYGHNHKTIGELSLHSMLVICEYFNINLESKLVHSANLQKQGNGSRRVLDIVSHLQADVYLSGHGGLQYLDHEAFESAGIRIEYMDYAIGPYPQQHEGFTPFVSSLDIIANVGGDGRKYMKSTTQHWREFRKQ